MSHETPSELLTVPCAEAVTAEKKPLGFWSTIGCYFLVSILSGLVCFTLSYGFFLKEMKPNILNFLDTVPLAGSILLFLIVADIVTKASLLFLLIKTKCKGWLISEYISLKSVPFRHYVFWLFTMELFLVGLFFLFRVLRMDLSEEWMISLYKSAPLFLIIFIVVIIGPAFEEIIFRGFLFRGIQNSRIGTVGAVIVTGLLWALEHTQYGINEIIALFLAGLVLGIVRWKTDSIYPCMVIHMVMNLDSLITVAIKAGG